MVARLKEILLATLGSAAVVGCGLPQASSQEVLNRSHPTKGGFILGARINIDCPAGSARWQITKDQPIVGAAFSPISGRVSPAEKSFTQSAIHRTIPDGHYRLTAYLTCYDWKGNQTDQRIFYHDLRLTG